MPEQSDTKPYAIPQEVADRVRRAYPNLQLNAVPGIPRLYTLLATPEQAREIFEKAGLSKQTAGERPPASKSDDDLEAQLREAEAAAGEGGQPERRRLTLGDSEEQVERRSLGGGKPPAERRRL